MMNRRSFLKTSAAAAAPLLLARQALGQARPGANDVVNVGIIGLGGRAREIATTCFGIPGMRIVAICDCFQPRLDNWMAKKPEHQQWTPYLDFREMIEKENLDGVMVETTTHARAWVTCHAMAMGMDAYIEKPMALTIAEGRQMVACARKHKRVTQIGTQQRSIPLNNWASDLVKKGRIGKIKTVLAGNYLGPERWTPQPEQPMPEGANEGWWDIWLNQSEFRPYHPDLHLRWNHWWDYDGGGRSFGVTGWGTHGYDQAQRALGTDETGPVELMLLEPVRVKPCGMFPERTPAESETGQGYYGMVRESVGPRADVMMRFAKGTEFIATYDGDWGPGLGAIFVGEQGTIEINRDRISASDPEIIAGDDRPEPLAVPETQPHIENWVDGIKTRKRCNADIEYGQRATTLCYLVNIARELGEVGKPLQWDPKKELFTNSDAGNALLTRARREGWELPA